jgi:DNA-binding MarR family transcriptional regulator
MALVTDALYAIAHADSHLTVVELAARLDCTPNDVARALSVLQAQGLVQRSRDRVALTKLGHRCVPVAS